MKDIVIDLFKNNKSAYAIHIETGLGIKEVYHYIRESEELRVRHLKMLQDNKDL